MEKILSSVKGVMNSISLSEERIEKNTLSQQDRKTMSLAIGEIIEDINNRELKNKGIETLKEQLANLQDAFFSQQSEQILQLHNEISDGLKPMEYEVNFNRLTADIFQAESQIMTLQDEKASAIQELINLDMQVHGQLTDMTKQVLEVNHVNVEEESVDAAAKEEQQTDIASGKDITPTYLQLPPMGKEEFKKTVTYLKENGALYNAHKKAWYVTPEQDFNKFKEYLPEKDSILPEKEKKEPMANTAEELINQLEKERMIFTGYERNLIVNYAFHINDMEKVSRLADRIIASHEGSENYFTIEDWVEKEIENKSADKESSKASNSLIGKLNENKSKAEEYNKQNQLKQERTAPEAVK